MTSLEGMGALVTGGASGIGRATTLALARAGAAVAIGDLDAPGADRVADEVRAGGGTATSRRCDVARPDDIDALVGAAQKELGALDVVFGNAGVLAAEPLEELGLESFERHLAVNLTANFLLAKLTAPALRERGGGAMVFTASAGGLRGSAGSAAYNASKGGLVNLTRSLADELGPDGIRVNCICPGWVDTPFNDPVWARQPTGAAAAMTQRIPLRRQATPGDVAPTVVFLASDAARYVTGHALVVDGGLLAT